MRWPHCSNINRILIENDNVRRNQNINIQLVKARLERDKGGKESEFIQVKRPIKKIKKYFKTTPDILKRKLVNEYLNKKIKLQTE